MPKNLLFIILGYLFITGKGITFGIEGSEAMFIAIPHEPIAGWALIALTLPASNIGAIKRKITQRKGISLLERVKEVEDNAEDCEETGS